MITHCQVKCSDIHDMISEDLVVANSGLVQKKFADIFAHC